MNPVVMIVFVSGFIPFLPLSVVEKQPVACKEFCVDFRKAWIGALASVF